MVSARVLALGLAGLCLGPDLGLCQVAPALGGKDDVARRLADLERLISGQQEQLLAQKAQMDLLRSLAPLGRLDGRKLQGSESVESLQGAMNHMWLILCGALVMFMQAGFAMVESGCCRAKNVQNILLKNLTDVCVGTLGWWLCGWAFAYGGPMDDDGFKQNRFMGSEGAMGKDFLIRDDATGQLQPTTNIVNWFFQWAFCSAAATIVSGGVAERVNFPGYCIFSFMMTAFIYPVCVGWTWGYGWLADVNSVGYMDFAGSGIVHMAGGVGALTGAIWAGPRKGRWENPEEFDPHSLPLIILGTFILWFGWYGFNCGSTLGMATIERGFMAAQVAMNTTIAAATGGLTVFILRFGITKKYDIGGFCNGILAGLVSITAGCGNVECGSAFVIALLGGLFYEAGSRLIKKLKIDDPVDAFAVHGVAGAWGVMAAALFDWGKDFDHYHGWSGFSCITAEDGSCKTGLGGEGVAANLAEVVAITAWVAVCSSLIFGPLRAVGWLRASDDVQDEGFDQAKHSPSKAYGNIPETTKVILSA
ncbi:unnamed protein product [Polarella glacialis]|uniref:Ammonium transporter n=1 Tax=Polarella glacialis TaxID=89957 RepID=A0A813FS36_POLGL|nr:unnamed protein product [Polarella glacialis]CAE8721609.1 unnamed protein product [Polarella glacialis]